jgi:hypothetical protein
MSPFAEQKLHKDGAEGSGPLNSPSIHCTQSPQQTFTEVDSPGLLEAKM